MITECKSLFDAVERHQGQGLGLSEKRTAVEVLAIRQISKATNITTKWVNSDRQLADIPTKDYVNPFSIQRMLTTRSWNIIWDPDFVAAKKIKRAARDGHFKGVSQTQSAAKSKQSNNKTTR
jgi:hypothetical protein